MTSIEFGLERRPFRLTPDPDFYYESRTHKKAMAYLSYGIAQGEGFIVVTGEIGSGKTTLAAELGRRIDSARLTLAVIASTRLEGDDLLAMVARSFGIAAEGLAKATLLDRIEAFLAAEAEAGKRALLVVDEAQNLPRSALEELRLLSNFSAGGRALIQIVLLGQPEFRDRLAEEGMEQLRQRVIASHHLGPVGADEIGGYIAHRLGQAGWEGRPVFADEALAAVHEASGGIPRRINRIASRLLLHAGVEERAEIDAGDVESVLADMERDEGERGPERPLPLRAANAEPGDMPAAAPPSWLPVAGDKTALAAGLAEQEERIAALEEQLAEQREQLRRVLSLMVEFLEAEERQAGQPALYRDDAAA